MITRPGRNGGNTEAGFHHNEVKHKDFSGCFCGSHKKDEQHFQLANESPNSPQIFFSG